MIGTKSLAAATVQSLACRILKLVPLAAIADIRFHAARDSKIIFAIIIDNFVASEVEGGEHTVFGIACALRWGVAITTITTITTIIIFLVMLLLLRVACRQVVVHYRGIDARGVDDEGEGGDEPHLD